jgi:septum formation protein
MLGLAFTVVPPERELSAPPGAPARAVAEIARGKAREVAQRFPDELIIAADTLVYLDGTPLGKPESAADAAGMLARLSGREHRVYTGVCILRAGRGAAFCEESAVRFREISKREIRAYIATGEPLDKAGAYAIQGRGAVFISGITGDFFNVMGLPVCALANALREFNVEVL